MLKIFEQRQVALEFRQILKEYFLNDEILKKALNLPTPSAIPKAMRDKNRVVTDEANIGVKKVISDQHNTAKVKTFFPPKRFEQLPPIILIK